MEDKIDRIVGAFLELHDAFEEESIYFVHAADLRSHTSIDIEDIDSRPCIIYIRDKKLYDRIVGAFS